jgi:hypothetical protein
LPEAEAVIEYGLYLAQYPDDAQAKENLRLALEALGD